MIRVCAWCNTELERTAASPRDGATHTICASCWDNIAFQQGVGLTRFLNSLAVPILVVRDDERVQTANRAARALVGKSLAQLRGRLGGDVFECKYARLPEGCGRTVHCSACAIRRTVMDTFATGESHYRVPATLDYCGDGMDCPLAFYITTRKDGDVVFLQVEPAE